MNSMEKFNRHIGQKVMVIVDGEEFEFKPLTFEQFGKLFILGSKVKDGNMDAESTTGMLEVFRSIVQHSYPDLDKDTAEAFVLKHMDVLSSALEKLMPVANVNPEMKARLDQLRNKDGPKTT